MASPVINPLTPDGANFGQSTADKIGFYGLATPIAQRTGANQVALTDSTTGTASNALAAGVGITTLAFYMDLASIAGNADQLTDYIPGYAFKILSVDFRVHKAVTTGAKAAAINLEIGTTNVTGGVVSLTSATCTPAGVAVAGTAVTAANTGTATDTLSIEASGVTAFVEGNGWLLVKIQNMDTANAAASIAAKTNELRASLVALNLISGAA